VKAHVLTYLFFPEELKISGNEQPVEPELASQRAKSCASVLQDLSNKALLSSLSEAGCESGARIVRRPGMNMGEQAKS